MNNENANTNTPTPESVRIAGQSLVFYWQSARIPALIAATVNVILIISKLQPVYLWGINLLLVIGLCIWLKLEERLSFGSAVALSSVAGFFSGAIVAVFRLIWERKLFLVFNLITEPLLTAAGAFALAALVVAILRSRLFARRAAPPDGPDSRKGVNHRA